MRPLPPSKLQLYILGYLSHKPAYGYEIYQYLLDNPLPYAYTRSRISPSAVYYALHSLRRQSLLISRQIKGSKAPAKEMFRISALGNRHLEGIIATEADNCRRSLRNICVQYTQQTQCLQWLDAIHRLSSGSQLRIRSLSS